MGECHGQRRRSPYIDAHSGTQASAADDHDVVITMLRYPINAGLFALLLTMGQTTGPVWSQPAAQPAETDSHTVSGVIEQLDLAANKGMLKTSLGKPIFFDIAKPELFQGITIGQQITIQLDERGRAIKAIESHSIPELPAPTH
jgi:hypothetical protein